MQTSEVLNKAADLIEERGWGRGVASMTGDNGLCLMGGIHAATFGRFDDNYPAAVRCPAGRAVYDYLRLEPEDMDAGWSWNDTYQIKNGRAVPVRTKEEVLEVLRATAVIEAARENATTSETAGVSS